MFEERIEKLEKALDVVLYAYEHNKLFIESNSTTIDSAMELLKTIPDFMKETDERIKSLQDAFVICTKNTELHFNLIESQGRTINTMIETLEILTKR